MFDFVRKHTRIMQLILFLPAGGRLVALSFSINGMSRRIWRLK